MSLLYQPFTILLISTVAISSTLVITALKYRPTLGTRAFAVLMSTVAMWAFVALFETISQDPQTKIFSYNLKYLFIVITPVAWFAFGLYYSNRLRRLKVCHLAILMIVPLVTLVMVATNPYHHLMFTTLEWHEAHSFTLLYRQFGIWFWVHTAYSYVLLLLGFFFLAKSLIDSPSPYRSQMISLLVGGLAPWLCNMLFLFSLNPSPYMDLTPIAFTISGLAFMLGIMRYRLLDIVPIAHDIMIQHMNEGIIVVDADHRVLDLNPAAAPLVGMEQNDIIGLTADHIIPWWPQLALPDKAKVIDDHAIIEVTIDNKRHMYQASKSPLFGNDKTLGYLVVLRDITAIKLAEEAVRHSEERFRSLSENAPVIIFSLDQAGSLIYVNPTWQKQLGYPREEVLGKSFSEFVVENHIRPHTEIFKRLINGADIVSEMKIRFLHQDGSQRIFDATAAANSDTEGRVTGIIGLAKDINEERKLQDQLFQSQKMEAIGTLAGGISHDFNNLLMGMQANVSLLRLEAEPTKQLQEKLTRIEDQIQSGASLTRQLLGYARKGKYIVTSINLRGLIEDTLHVVQRTNKNIEVHRKLSNEPTFLDADRGQIELVLLNLFVNAVDAMPNGGDLTVSTRLADHLDLTNQWPELDPGRYIEITVSDTGTGMDQNTIDRIFEPFFTTKEIGRGTGLGLASVYGVVKNHGGSIRVDSKLAHGATFKLLFPASDKPMQDIVIGRSPEVLPTHKGKILVVDDEATILEYTGEMVQSLGFKVALAADGKEALRIYQSEHLKIDIVILDMVMPGMDGCDVFDALKKVNPHIKVIIASGYGPNERAELILSQGPHGNLKKPYTRKELAQTITKVLGTTVASTKGPRASAL